jgi:hypothetical protein
VHTGVMGTNGNACAAVSDTCQIIASEESGAHSATADLSFGTATTTTTSTTTTTIAGGSTGTTTTTTGSSGAGGSSDGPGTTKASLANTGSPRLMWAMIATGLAAIFFGFGMVQVPRRRRRLP